MGNPTVIGTLPVAEWRAKRNRPEPEGGAAARARYAWCQTDERAVDPNVLPAVIEVCAFVGGAADYGRFRERFRRPRCPGGNRSGRGIPPWPGAAARLRDEQVPDAFLKEAA